uniref:Putative adhesin P89 n=1 Tax=Spiroplasma citri TaxID=2133 RepID=Q9EV58_SPICI|nr:putative adhesin P89 [Spiroplasma citri]
MKKLLSILTISTLTASIPAPLLAAVPLTNTLTSNSNNDYLPVKQINGVNNNINSITIDKNNNLYFGTSEGAFVLKQGETTPTKIDLSKRFIYIHAITVDSKDNIYFGTTYGIYVLNAGSDTATKINDIDNVVSLAVDSKDNIYIGTQTAYGTSQIFQSTNGIISLVLNWNENNSAVWSLTIDSNDNIYIGTSEGAFVLKQGKTTPTKINGINNVVNSIAVDSNDNIYFGTANGAFVLKQGETTPTKIDGISGAIKSLVVDKYNNNIYIGTDNGIYFTTTVLDWVKQQSKFTLVDNTKKQTWTQNDLLSVDGELNIDIANPNIDKVVFDNVQQGQTNKHWTINVKPETAPRDHNLQVMFTLEGKQYTSEIIVSMQAKINPVVSSVKQNLSDLIKNIDLGNIFDNNDNTIFTAVNQKNHNIIDDFSQIEIPKKDNNSATLTAKKDSKSYAGSVDVKYNVVSATTVDLKIDVTPTSSEAAVIKDYLFQIDTSNITNPVNTFYYASSESIITMDKPTPSSVITGVVYGCDDKWNKTSQSSNIDSTNGIKLDGSQLATINGKYVVELSDNLGHTNNVYLQINEKKEKEIKEYWNTDNGKQFEIWAKANGYDNIRGYGASQLNNLFADSKNWQQLASDSQLASAVADRVKTSGKLSSTAPLTKEQMVEQLKTQIPSDIKIDKVNTTNYEKDKVSFVLNQSEFKPNDKVNITVKYNNATSEQFTLQIKDSNTPDNKKDGDSKLWIIGVVVGVLVVLGLVYLLFKKFVFDKYFLPKINKRRHDKLVEQVKKEEAEKDAQNNKGGEK